MKQTKRILSALTAAVLLGTFCGGCGKGNDVAAGGSSDETVQTELNLYYWDESFRDTMSEITSTFMADNPDIKVNMTTIPWGEYWTKLQTTLPSASGPDIFWLNYMYTLEFAPKGLLLPVEDASIQKEKFPEATLDMGMHDGTLYNVPFMLDTVALVYNKDLFDAAGVDYPTADWTWDDLREAAKKLTVKDANGKTTQYGYCVDPQSQMGTYNFLYQNGVSVYDEDMATPNFNSDAGREAFQFQYDIMYTDGSSPTGAQLEELGKDDRFMSGQIAMLYTVAPRMTKYYDAMGQSLDAAPLPQGKEAACTLNACSFAGSAKTAHPEQVQRFLAFAASEKCQKLMGKMAMPPYEGAAAEWASQFGDANAQAFIDAIDIARPLALTAKDAGATRKIFESECANLFAGVKDVNAALADAETQIIEQLQ